MQGEQRQSEATRADQSRSEVLEFKARRSLGDGAWRRAHSMVPE
jgi:hypothetical protein